MPIIDAHAHLVPAEFPPLPAGVNSRGWPTMLPLDDGRARMMIDGKQFRVLERAYFDLDARLELLEREHIALQVVSPLPELLGHWLSTDTATELARVTNETIAATVKQAPTRLAGLGMLPWQDIDASARMVADIAKAGLRGIEAGSNIDGRSIADPVFDPVFAELARHDMVLFVHGTRPAGTERLLGPGLMVNVIGIPQDCSLAIASFITTDVLARHPRLKLGFAHGGGGFGAVLDRMDFVWRGFPAVRETSRLSPREYVRRFYFDTVTYSVPYLRYLKDAYGVEALVCGTDGPATGAQYGLQAFVREVCGDDDFAAEAILWRNAARFIGLSL